MAKKQTKTIVNPLPTSEPWYGDGLVKYEHMGTAQDAIDTARSTSKFLRKWGKQSAQLLPIADRIASCSSGKRCKSVACPQCARAYQRSFVKLAKAVLRRAAQ